MIACSREIRRVDLRDILRQRACCLINQRAAATGRPDPRGVTLQRTGDPVEEIQPGGVDPPAGLDDERHEVALVPVLGHFYVVLRSARPGIR